MTLGHPRFDSQPCGVQSEGRVQQGMVRLHGLAKVGPTYFSGPVMSNAVLRFEKSSNAHHGSQNKDILYALGGSFIGISGHPFGLVFTNHPCQGGCFAFQAAFDLLPSLRPGVCQTLSSLYILETRLGLLDVEGTGYFDQLCGQSFSLPGRDHVRVVGH